jgi:hypothetical protein
MFGARSANRMGARQQYRTMARMQRRRSYFQGATGTHQDFSQRDDSNGQDGQASQSAEPTTTDQLEELAQLKSKGVITEDEFAAKKKQILGI